MRHSTPVYQTVIRHEWCFYQLLRGPIAHLRCLWHDQSVISYLRQ